MQLFVQGVLIAQTVAQIDFEVDQRQSTICATICAKKCMHALTRQLFHVALHAQRPIVVQCDVHKDAICAAG